MVKPFPIKTKVIHLINSLAHWFAKCFMSKLTRGFAIEQNLIRFMYLVLTQQRFTWLPVVDEESGETYILHPGFQRILICCVSYIHCYVIVISKQSYSIVVVSLCCVLQALCCTIAVQMESGALCY